MHTSLHLLFSQPWQRWCGHSYLPRASQCELSSRGVSRQEGNPKTIKGRDTEPCRIWETKHLLPCTVVSGVPKCTSLTISGVCQHCYSSSAAKTQPLFHPWHSIPRDKGTQKWVLLALETGLESIHPNRQSGYGWVLGIQQAGAQLGEIPGFKGIKYREKQYKVNMPQWLQEKAHRGGQAVPLWKYG